MASIERKINGTFAPVPGGYAQQINEQTTLFVPDFSAARYDPKTGELFGYAPDYAALEAEKAPAVQADKPGEYVYCYEMQQARRSFLLRQALLSPPAPRRPAPAPRARHQLRRGAQHLHRHHPRL